MPRSRPPGASLAEASIPKPTPEAEPVSFLPQPHDPGLRRRQPTPPEAWAQLESKSRATEADLLLGLPEVREPEVTGLMASIATKLLTWGVSSLFTE